MQCVTQMHPVCYCRLLAFLFGDLHGSCLSCFVMQLRGTTLTLCRPTSLQDFCCTDLSHDSNTPEALYGIEKGMVITDILNYNVMTAYKFSGKAINCSKGEWMLCAIHLHIYVFLSIFIGVYIYISTFLF